LTNLQARLLPNHIQKMEVFLPYVIMFVNVAANLIKKTDRLKETERGVVVCDCVHDLHSSRKKNWQAIETYMSPQINL